MDDELLSKFLSGRATDEEIARLRAELEGDPSAVDALFDAAELERDLGEVHRSGAVGAAPKPRRRFWILLAAAAVVVLSVAGFFLFTPEPPLDVARVQKVEGLVYRLGPEGRTLLAAGELLQEGVGLETNGSGRVVLRYDDGTTVEFRSQTTAKGFASRGGKKFTLDRGSVSADVAGQQADRPLLVRTLEGEARVLGTKFTLSAKPGSTRLDVEKGLVRLTRLSDGKSADVAADHTAVAGSNGPPIARPTTAAVGKMAPGTWLAVPESAMASVVPDRSKFPAVQGIMGPAGVIGAWSGGVFDPQRGRLVVWGGGYSDYHGNELYAFALGTMSWQRLTDPTPRPRLGEEENDDGSPNARATYNGLAYLTGTDRFFALGGARAGNGFSCRVPWTFDFDAKKWTKKSPSGPNPAATLGATCSYDPVTHKVWWGDTSGIYSLDVDSNRWTKHGDDEFYYCTGAVDTKRGLWIVIGQGKVSVYDIRKGNPLRQAWPTTGAEALVARANPGFDYDPLRNRMVAWAGGPVYTLDPETKTWTVTDAPGSPAPTANGIFGRWRYAPAVDAFIVVTAFDRNVHFYRPAK